MIINAAGTLALSSFGWVDAGSLWSYALGEPETKQNHLSDAKWLTLVRGAEDYFAVVHHFEDGRVRLTSHSYRNVSETISSIELLIEDINSNDVKVAVSRFTGEGSAWSFLPRAYVVRPFGEAFLLLIDWTHKATQLQSPSWYKGSYDTMYQAILSVTEVPGSSLLIFSIQRDSEPLLFDPTTSKIVQKLTLAHRRGNPQLYFRRMAPELWVSDYDTLVRLDSRNWNLLSTLRLQEGLNGVETSNIGEYYFSRDESLCLVARPHSGDVLAIDPNTFTVTLQVETGGQPEDVGLLRGGLAVARDLETGRLLLGTLRSV